MQRHSRAKRDRMEGQSKEKGDRIERQTGRKGRMEGQVGEKAEWKDR